MFPVAAALLGLFPFVLVEITLALCGVGDPRDYADPFVGFSRTHPLFQLNESTATWSTAVSRGKEFGHQKFAAKKPPRTFRIFCLGGSTVRGRPYETSTAFAKWLELELNGRDSSRRYEVVNCGGVSYASYRLLPILKEVLGYDPDLIIVATGHNEFLEDRTYQSIKYRSGARAWIEDRVHSLRTVTLLRRLFRGEHAGGLRDGSVDAAGRTILPDEVATRLDRESGYASYHRSETWRKQVVEHFERTVRGMVEACLHRDVPLMLVNLGSNLRDCPPFKSEHRAGMSANDESAWQAAFAAATETDAMSLHPALTGARRAFLAHDSRNPRRTGGRLPRRKRRVKERQRDSAQTIKRCRTKVEQSLSLYRRAEKIDGQHALLVFRIARCLDRLGRFDEARKMYQKAKELDVCPLRMIESLHQRLSRIADENSVTVVDPRARLEARSPERICGNDLYVDHVHPTIAGHQIIAQAVAETLEADGVVNRNPNWNAGARRTAYRKHVQGLEAAYVRNGRRRIRWLEGWSRRTRLFAETLPVDMRGFLQYGQKQLELGDVHAAWQAFDAALAADPTRHRDLSKYAVRLLMQGRTESSRHVVGGLRDRLEDSQLPTEVWLAELVFAVETDELDRASAIYRDHRDKLLQLNAPPAQWLDVFSDAMTRAKLAAGG